MEGWSILSDHVKYIKYDKSDAFHNLSFDPLNYQLNEDLYKN